MRHEFTTDAWCDLRNEESELVKELNQYPFHEIGSDYEHVDKQALMMSGLLNCAGSDEVKAKIFYNLLQDPT